MSRTHPTRTVIGGASARSKSSQKKLLLPIPFWVSGAFIFRGRFIKNKHTALIAGTEPQNVLGSDRFCLGVRGKIIKDRRAGQGRGIARRAQVVI